MLCVQAEPSGTHNIHVPHASSRVFLASVCCVCRLSQAAHITFTCLTRHHVFSSLMCVLCVQAEPSGTHNIHVPHASSRVFLASVRLCVQAEPSGTHNIHVPHASSRVFLASVCVCVCRLSQATTLSSVPTKPSCRCGSGAEPVRAGRCCASSTRQLPL